MKPQFGSTLLPIIEYINGHSDFNSIPNDIESLKSKMSIFKPNADINSVTNDGESLTRKNYKHTITPNKAIEIKNFYSGNSIDQ